MYSLLTPYINAQTCDSVVFCCKPEVVSDLLKQRDQVIKSLDFMLERYLSRRSRRKAPVPAFLASLPWRQPPSFQAGKIQFIGYHFQILRKCLEGSHSLCWKLSQGVNKRGATFAKEVIAAGRELTKSSSWRWLCGKIVWRLHKILRWTRVSELESAEFHHCKVI